MKKILIVDDEPDVAGAMKLLVDGAGYYSDTCLDPVSALGKAKDYGLLLLDIMMPQLSGLEFLRRMKKAGLDVPVIVVSAVSLPLKVRKQLADAYPPIEFVTKTHMGTDLLPAISKKIEH
jgi:DNA-binding response OmpR family regulator